MTALVPLSHTHHTSRSVWYPYTDSIW